VGVEPWGVREKELFFSSVGEWSERVYVGTKEGKPGVKELAGAFRIKATALSFFCNGGTRLGHHVQSCGRPKLRKEFNTGSGGGWFKSKGGGTW